MNDPADRPVRGTELRAMLDEENNIIRQAHFAGAGGGEVVQRRTSLIDRTLRGIHVALPLPASLPTIVAVGGYGRGELNPHSDIDLLFLCGSETERHRAPDLLYPLWDAGLEIGYSVRTIPECIEMARRDIKIRTSLMESRLVTGQAGLFTKLTASLRSEVFYWKASAFIQQKLAERVAERRKWGGSLYLREPNIKDGEGGLRDLHTALWVACVRYRVSALAELVSSGVISQARYASAVRTRSYLWRIRNELHYLSGRKNDHLTFDLQEQAAKDFRFRDSDNLYAVERLMKYHFIHARALREFVQIVITAAVKKAPTFWFSATRQINGFSLIGKTLFSQSPDMLSRQPELIMTAFRLAHERNLVLSEGLARMIRECRFGEEVRRSSVAMNAFLAIMDRPEGLAGTLEQMRDLKFLGRYLPEFRAIQSLSKHDLYHLYTVDEHLVMAVRNLERVWSGDYPSSTPLSDAMKRVRKRWVLFLAVLLHDLGKVHREGHEVYGMSIAQTVLDRLSVPSEERDRILFMIRNHLVMTQLSQRRELSDSRIIEGFARLVRDRTNLDMLYLLTFADISAVNPGSWTPWKAALLQELYLRTAERLELREAADIEQRVRFATALNSFRAQSQGMVTDAARERFIQSMPEQYFLAIPVKRILEQMDMVEGLADEKLIIRHAHHPDRGYTELTICAYDAYGMFHRAAAAISSNNLSILRAQIFTSRDGVMIDTFQITDAEGMICPYEDVWASVLRELRAALLHDVRPHASGWERGRQKTSVTVTPTVEFDNETSDAFTIIDITARDRLGLLYSVSKALYDLNIDICSAKIVTEGARAMDAFYVTDLISGKITAPERIERIREKLFSAIAA